LLEIEITDRSSRACGGSGVGRKKGEELGGGNEGGRNKGVEVIITPSSPRNPLMGGRLGGKRKNGAGYGTTRNPGGGVRGGVV